MSRPGLKHCEGPLEVQSASLGAVNPSEFLSSIFGATGAAPVSSNLSAQHLPFQRWMKFKEAFSPRFVADVLNSLDYRPTHCIDPFGGSGTTAFSCALLGVDSTTIEVNPFLVDVIRAKTSSIRAAELKVAYDGVLRNSKQVRVSPEAALASGPQSLVEPGIGGRFVFWRDAIERILSLRNAIALTEASENARLTLMVLLGSILVEASNVVVNGKGRRYRQAWQGRKVGAVDVDRLFLEAVLRCIEDLVAAEDCRRARVSVMSGDSRRLIQHARPADIAIFSPPYPNSFDYTDVYNLELWVLGYLTSADANRALRRMTLRSHVQLGFDPGAPVKSLVLSRALEELTRVRDRLWDNRIPAMILAYFDDIRTILILLREKLIPGSRVFMIIGDSRYAGVYIDVAATIIDILSETGYRLHSRKNLRSMRSSAQHGGSYELAETCLVLHRV